MIKGENFNTPGNKPRILIAPLDWGLGHATRCIPVISALIKQGCTVIVASEGHVKSLLQKEFPHLPFLQLKGYRVRYSRYKWWMPVKLMLQLPGIFNRIYAEKKWLNKVVETNQVDAVIADNRMGLHHKKIPCIYITHQLTIKTGNRFTENIAQKIHYHFINKFSACWVPDMQESMNLAGGLSHPYRLPKVPVTYMGPLSRFEKRQVEKKYDLCIILSGPEPQRTVLEKMILRDLANTQLNVFIARGLPGENSMPELQNTSIEIKNHLPSRELGNIIQQSDIVICRSGYSTVMDLFRLQKKAILVATPGQTEQEYLARYLHLSGLFYGIAQDEFSLPLAIKNASLQGFTTWPPWEENYETVISDFIENIRTRSAGT